MLKHYIHCHEGFNLNKGGSVGYLSTLYTSFEQYSHNITELNIQNCFLFPNVSEGERIYNRSLEEIIWDDFKYINEFENKNGMQVLINERKRWFREVLPLSEYSKIDFRNICSIHIHGAYNFLPVFNTLCKEGVENKVIKILTTHNPHKPELEDMELISRGRAWSDADLETLKYFFKQRDYWAFKLSDALIFPTEYSMEGYFKTWPEFKDIIKDKKVYFCTTSGQEKSWSIDTDIMRRSLNIPDDAMVLLYLGRFVNIRGYDILIETAKRIIPDNSNVYFVVVGESVREQSFDTPQWIQIPFTNEPGNYINMADACLCPNKGSLFDLSMIEILASGTPLLGCNIGGYKWLKGKTSGAFLAEPENIDDFERIVRGFLKITDTEKQEMSKQNRELYQNSLHLKYFHQEYIKTVTEIYDDFGINQKSLPHNRSQIQVSFEANYKRNFEQEFLVASPSSKIVKADQPSMPKVVIPAEVLDVSVMKKSQLNKQTSIQRKWNKLQTNPRLFFTDMFRKKINQARGILGRK